MAVKQFKKGKRGWQERAGEGRSRTAKRHSHTADRIGVHCKVFHL